VRGNIQETRGEIGTVGLRSTIEPLLRVDGRNKQPSAGGQRTSGRNPAIDSDPYSPSSVDSRVNNLENRR